MSHVIATCAPESTRAALRELQSAAVPASLATWLDAGVALLETHDAAALADSLAAAPPVFVRHLAPADLHVPLIHRIEDIAALTAAVEPYLRTVLPEYAGADCPPHAVQVRLGQANFPYTRYAVAEPLRALLAPYGPEDVRHPRQVLSVYCAPGRAYAGLWPVARCLSNWPGGERRFARTPDQVSRSEFKLLEALEVFEVELPAHGHALDLGAAPGGWTRLLAERGLSVVAVDPAALDPRVAALPGVQHHQVQADAFLKKNTDPFDLIMNDMRMDARDSARLMQRAVACLRPGGVVLMTLKLPQAHAEAVYRYARRLLEQTYTVLGARQLFHNRHEVTLALRSDE